MTTMASQITSITVVYSTVYSDAVQRKHQSSASLGFVWGIHRDRWIPRTKGQLRGKCFHLMTSSWSSDVIMVQFTDAYMRTPVFVSKPHFMHLLYIAFNCIIFHALYTPHIFVCKINGWNVTCAHQPHSFPTEEWMFLRNSRSFNLLIHDAECSDLWP